MCWKWKHQNFPGTLSCQWEKNQLTGMLTLAALLAKLASWQQLMSYFSSSQRPLQQEGKLFVHQETLEDFRGKPGNIFSVNLWSRSESSEKLWITSVQTDWARGQMCPCTSCTCSKWPIHKVHDDITSNLCDGRNELRKLCVQSSLKPELFTHRDSFNECLLHYLTLWPRFV